MRLRGSSPACLLAGLFFTVSLHAAPVDEGTTRHSIDPDTGLSTWEADTQGVYLRLTQISPEQARAFMQGRGMDRQSVEEFAHACVYMTVVRNESKRAIEHTLTDWRYRPQGGEPRSMLTKRSWLARWQMRNFPKPVKVAFEWSQFPTEQVFAPGDWNQGMTTFELPAGSHFDLLYRWKQAGKFHEGKLQNVQCPASFD